VAGLFALLAYPAVAVWYAGNEHFFDNAEPTITAIGWLFHVGQPLYPPPDSAHQYAHIYGPMAYILHGYALAGLGADIRASKALGAAAGIASLAFLYAAIRSHSAARRAASLTGICALLLLVFRDYSFWTRPDPLQLLAVSAALCFAATGTGYVAAALVGVASGLLWNLKFTGPLYSLPILALLHHRNGASATLVALVTGVVVTVMPFALFPNVSLAGYLSWVHLSAKTGLLLFALRQNLEWAAYFGLPVFLSYYAVPRERRRHEADWRDVIAALAVGACGVVLAAAKPGAGPYHLLPFLPIIFFVVSWQLSNSGAIGSIDPMVSRAAIAFLVATVAIALAQQAQLITVIRERATVREVDDIRAFASTHDGVVEMGYGQTEASSFGRPVLVFRNNSYLIDQPAVREHQLAGLEIPQATIDEVTSCRIRYWLIPKGETPFSAVDSYAAVFGRPLYAPEFRAAFTSAYQLVERTRYYDVWQCRTTIRP
jgi:hypothetical protein